MKARYYFNIPRLNSRGVARGAVHVSVGESERMLCKARGYGLDCRSTASGWKREPDIWKLCARCARYADLVRGMSLAESLATPEGNAIWLAHCKASKEQEERERRGRQPQLELFPED